MTTTTHPERVKLPVCPPWCAGHDGIGYQGWEDTGVGGHQRDHGSAGEPVAGSVAVDVSLTENALGEMGEPHVGLYLALDREDLTPVEARKVAAALLAAAELAGLPVNV